jgi:hypothetical protein
MPEKGQSRRFDDVRGTSALPASGRMGDTVTAAPLPTSLPLMYVPLIALWELPAGRAEVPIFSGSVEAVGRHRI